MINQLFANQKIKIALIIVGVLILFNVVVAINNTLFPSLPPISSTSPSNNATKIVLNQPVVISFKKPIQVTDFLFTSDPSLSWDLTQTSANTITASHSLDFQPSSTYALNLTWKNRAYSPIIFTTMVSQVDPLFIKQTNDELARDYPLAQKFPYETPGFRIVYSAPLTLEISLKNKNITDEEAFAYARQYVKDNGLDPSTHKYIISDALYIPPSPAVAPAKAGLTSPSPSPSATEINWDTLQNDGT